MKTPRLDGQFDFVDLEEPMETQAGYVSGRDLGDESQATEPIEHNGHLFVERPVPGGIMCEMDGTPTVFFPVPQPLPTIQDYRIVNEILHRRARVSEARVAALETQLELALTEQTLMRADFYAIQDQEGAAYQERIAAEYHARRMAEIRVAALEAQCADLQGARELSNKVNRYHVDVIDAMTAKVQTAEARVAALEEALRPLAALADHVDRQGFADEQTLWTYGVWGDPTAYRALAAGHARAARRALDGQEVRGE